MSRILIRITATLLVLLSTSPALDWGGYGHKLPVVNNADAWVLWAFMEMTDPLDAQSTVCALLATAPYAAKGDPHAHAT